ncbi:MAG: hypothetical protein AAGC82_13770 [Pseudomonadota bacterium]
MTTLILEPDPLQARHWLMHFGAACTRCDVARSTAQARLMLIATSYDRLCLRMGDMGGASYALLSVARATNPDCEIVDLNSLRSRRATGPIDEGTASFQPNTAPIIG